MEDFQHVGYSKEVIEFVAVVKEFCDFVETVPQMRRKDFVQRLQKFIPLIYLKGALLPESDVEEEGLTEDFVTEEHYNFCIARYIGCWGNTMNIWRSLMIICNTVRHLLFILLLKKFVIFTRI